MVEIRMGQISEIENMYFFPNNRKVLINGAVWPIDSTKSECDVSKLRFENTVAENWKWFEFDLTESIDNNVIDAASLMIS